MAEKVILGLTEPVQMRGNNGKKIDVVARIDTGATSSSIDSNLAGSLELGPVVRTKVVKSASGVKRRPIVMGKISIHNIDLDEEFTLADRSHMTYQILIGQNILKKGNFLIDPLKEASK